MDQRVIEARDLLLQHVTENNSYADIDKIRKAFDMAYNAHIKQARASGEPYILHPIAVADILTELKLDTASIVTALLHDTVEDTELTIAEIEEAFGKEAAQLVDGVTKLAKIEYQPEHVKQAENFRKLLLAVSADIRVMLIKLADRVHNMRTLHYIESKEKRVRIAHETMEIYSPLAERMGIHKFKNELQDLAFAELYHDVRQSILTRLSYLRQEGEPLVKMIEKEISEVLKKNNIKALISGREKTCCSIWYKMESKDVTFEQISDIMAFRIIVDNVMECYQALGAIHSSYHNISYGFKDYISTPKSNGYQSIHTLIMGPEQRCVEIQIRTHDMHEVAELGVAAHWAYKQRMNQTTEGKQFRWVRELLEILENTLSPEEFLENTKLEMYYDQVFCFSPKGDLIALPKGSTPVDFAFAVHSKVGLTCVGAKVNSSIVPLKSILENGDQVEIVRSNNPMPSASWEKFVVTGKARAEIRKFIRAKRHHEYVALGKSLLTKEFQQLNRKYEEKTLRLVLAPLKRTSVIDLLAAVGEGGLSRHDVFKVIHALEENKKSNRPISAAALTSKKLLESKKQRMPIKGLIPGMAIHFAECCHPLPGDNIAGIVNSGKGVTIHMIECEVLKGLSNSPERWIDISWEESVEDVYVGRLKVSISNELWSLAQLTTSIAHSSANLANFKIINRSSDYFELLLDVEVKGLNQLNSVITALRMLSNVHRVERKKE